MNNKTLRFSLVLLFIVVIISLRFALVDFANFAPITAAGIFAVYYLRNKWLAITIPLVAFFASDLLLELQTGNALYAGRSFDYIAIIAAIVIAYFIFQKSQNWKSVLSAAVIGSLSFFIISNFAVWAFGNMYVKSIDGLVQCFVNAIPFYRGTFAGDLIFTGVFFGFFEVLLLTFPQLQLKRG